MEPFWPFYVYAAFTLGLGAILGSFLNVLILRYGTGEGIGGRSHCMRCGHELSALDLVPILSFLWLGGRCRFCGTRISPQYPLVEAAAAALSLGIYLAHPNPVSYVLGLFIWTTLLFLFVYDLRHKMLPLPAVALLMVLGVVSALMPCLSYCSAQILQWPLLAGPAAAAPLLLLSAISFGRWMGWGDGLMMLGIGWVLGFSEGLTALVLGFWSGAVLGVCLIGWSRTRTLHTGAAVMLGTQGRGFTMKSEIPFGPFLIVGAAVAYFFHVDLFPTFLL
jgi:leader peptidase (prepilin peptidase)/N-methyltransferase